MGFPGRPLEVLRIPDGLLVRRFPDGFLLVLGFLDGLLAMSRSQDGLLLMVVVPLAPLVAVPREKTAMVV